MKDIPDKSIDMVLCDLPYGNNKTACKWDVIIPFEPLWNEYGRVIKDNGAIVLTASQPFTSQLIMSNAKMFKYEWIWQKEQGVGFQVAKYRPMQEHEHILVFGKGKIKYNPQMEKLEKPRKQKRKCNNGESLSSPLKYSDERVSLYTSRFPTSIKKFNRDRGPHPTQKPVALLEYLIKTYTNENETILDNCIGSGSTAVAVMNVGEGRKYIGIEKDKTYYDIANKRINEALSK